MENIDIKKEKIKENLSKIFDDIDEETFKWVENFSKKEKERKQKLEELAESYFTIYSILPNRTEKENLEQEKRLGYYQIIGDCLELLKTTDKGIRLGFCVPEKEEKKNNEQSKNNMERTERSRI